LRSERGARRRALGTLAALLVWTALAAGVATGTDLVHAGRSRQEALAAGVEATLLVSARIDTLPAPPAILGAATVQLSPGATTRPFVSRGPVIVRVEGGTLTHRAADGATRTLERDGSATFPSGQTVRLENAGGESVRLLVIWLASAPTGSATTSEIDDGGPAARRDPTVHERRSAADRRATTAITTRRGAS